MRKLMGLIALVVFSGSSYAETYPALQGKLSIESADVYNDGNLSLRVVIQDSCHWSECRSNKTNLIHHFEIPVNKDGSYTVPQFELNQPRGSISVVIFQSYSNTQMNIIDRPNDIEFLGTQEYEQFASGFTVEDVKPVLSFDFKNQRPVEAIKALFAKNGVDIASFGNPRYSIDVEGYFQWEIASPNCCHLMRYSTAQFGFYRVDAGYEPKIVFTDLPRVVYPTYFKNFKRNNSFYLSSVYARIYDWYSPTVKRAVKSAEVSLIREDKSIISVGDKSKLTLTVEP